MTRTPSGFPNRKPENPRKTKAVALRVCIYAKDGINSSSAYYRVIQYRDAIEASGGVQTLLRVLVPEPLRRMRYDLEGQEAGWTERTLIKTLYATSAVFRGVWFLTIDLLRGANVVIVVRSLFPKTFLPPLSSMYRRLLQRADRVIWDIDDDIVYSGELGSGEHRLLLHESKNIVVTHDGLRKLIPNAGNKVRLQPTTDGDFQDIELDAVGRERAARYVKEFRIVWVGSSAGLGDLRMVAAELDGAAEALQVASGVHIVLDVVCNLPLEYEFRSLTLVNSRWSRPTAIQSILRAHIGIMPLEEGQFAEGKGAFKLVQYMAGGLPVVASKVGFNSVVIDHGVTGYLVPTGDSSGWINAILALATDRSNWNAMSIGAIERWSREFSFAEAAKFWSESTTGAALNESTT